MKKDRLILEMPLRDETLRALANRLRLDDIILKHNNDLDATATLEWILGTIIDGRPQPFSLLGSYGDILKFINDQEERREEERRLTYFAEVGYLSKEYPDECAALIANQEFNLPELKEFRNWIDSVIHWHERE